MLSSAHLFLHTRVHAHIHKGWIVLSIWCHFI